MSLTETIGRRIKAHREFRDWSQSDLAQRLQGGLSKQSIISEIERGKRGLQVEELLQIADALGVHPYYHLIADDENTLNLDTEQDSLTQIESMLLHNFRLLPNDRIRMSFMSLLMSITASDDEIPWSC